MNLSLEREGEFEPVGMRENNHRCGPIGSMRYRYHVKIDATDESLSPEGFIIENGRVQEYFVSNYCSGKEWDALSCELMAARAAVDLGLILVAEDISVLRVTVTVFGSNNAKLMATWERSGVLKAPALKKKTRRHHAKYTRKS
jgi:hypothetical protein